MFEKFLIFLLNILICLKPMESRDITLHNNKRGFCGVDDTSTKFDFPNSVPSPEQRQSRKSLTLELGVFYEQYMSQKFNNDETKLKKYLKILLSGVQAVYKYPSMRTRVQLIVTRFEMVPENRVPRKEMLRNYNASLYKDSFCKWQWNTYGKDRNYDLALFLVRTRLHYHYKQNGKDKWKIIEGLANMESVCYPQAKDKSCAMINVSYLDTVWVVAHEIMHTFGIQHIGRDCGDEGIMHPSGEGLFLWSNCTDTAFEKFLAEDWKSSCLFNNVGTPLRDWDLNAVPFHSMSMTEQCASNYGLKYYVQPFYTNECRILFCQFDLLEQIHNSRPPLDGTKCGKSDMGWGTCIMGKCVVESA